MRNPGKVKSFSFLMLPVVAGGLVLYANQRVMQRENLYKKNIADHLKIKTDDPSWQDIEDRIDAAVSTQELHTRLAKKWYQQFLQKSGKRQETALPRGAIRHLPVLSPGRSEDSAHAGTQPAIPTPAS